MMLDGSDTNLQLWGLRTVLVCRIWTGDHWFRGPATSTDQGPGHSTSTGHHWMPKGAVFKISAGWRSMIIVYYTTQYSLDYNNPIEGSQQKSTRIQWNERFWRLPHGFLGNLQTPAGRSVLHLVAASGNYRGNTCQMHVAARGAARCFERCFTLWHHNSRADAMLWLYSRVSNMASLFHIETIIYTWFFVSLPVGIKFISLPDPKLWTC